MTPEIITLILVVWYALASLAILSLGGHLVRHDLVRAQREGKSPPRGPSRLVEDLRPLQNVVVEFFAHSEYFSRALKILARHEKPLGGNRLQEGRVPPGHIRWPATCILAVTGLVQFRRRGLVLTDIGREVQRRITDNASFGVANGET